LIGISRRFPLYPSFPGSSGAAELDDMYHLPPLMTVDLYFPSFSCIEGESLYVLPVFLWYPVRFLRRTKNYIITEQGCH
jgi:hypothetical protein